MSVGEMQKRSGEFQLSVPSCAAVCPWIAVGEAQMEGAGESHPIISHEWVRGQVAGMTMAATTHSRCSAGKAAPKTVEGHWGYRDPPISAG